MLNWIVSTRALWLVALLVVAGWLADAPGQAGAAYVTPRIASVTPDPSYPGQTVTLGLTGYGSYKPVIFFDGRIVSSAAWNNQSLSFVVPPDTVPGRKLVVVWAPVLKIAWRRMTIVAPPPPFDGIVAPQRDTAASVTEIIGPAGGAIAAGGATLTVPPLALLEEQAITMTPLTGVGGMPTDAILDAVHFEPEGLRFMTPATLTLPRPAAGTTGDLVAFLYDGAGVETHLAPYVVKDTTIELLISHFSGGGSASGGASLAAFSPNGPQAQAEQQIATATRLYERGTIGDVARNAAYDQALRAWYQSVYAGFQTANPSSGAPVEYLELAINDWNTWRAWVTILDREAALANELAAGQGIARIIAQAHLQHALQQCTGADPDPFISVPPVVRLGIMFDTDPETFDLALIDPALSSANDLVSLCVRIEIDPLDAPNVFARASDRNTIEVHARFRFHNGPARTDLPLRIKLEEVTQDPGPPLRADEIVSDGQLEKRVDIVEPGGSSRILATVSPVQPGLETLTAAASVDRPVRNRTELEHAIGGGSFSPDLVSINEGSSATFRVQLAGDGMDGQLVQFALASGEGSVQPASGTTSAFGLTAFTYDAPSQPTATVPSCVEATWSYDGDPESTEDCFDIDAGTPTPTPTSVVLPTATPTPLTPSNWSWIATSFASCNPTEGCFSYDVSLLTRTQAFVTESTTFPGRYELMVSLLPVASCTGSDPFFRFLLDGLSGSSFSGTFRGCFSTPLPATLEDGLHVSGTMSESHIEIDIFYTTWPLDPAFEPGYEWVGDRVP